MKKNIKEKIFSVLLIFSLMVTGVVSIGTKKTSAAEQDKLKKACVAAVKATGNVKKLTYKTSTPSDFEAISYQHDKKVKAMYYVTSDNTVYNVCVARARTAEDAVKLYKAFADYKKIRLESEYFKTDFTKKEQNVMRNAIYGQRGTYIWYISMSSKKKNYAGQAALKKKL